MRDRQLTPEQAKNMTLCILVDELKDYVKRFPEADNTHYYLLIEAYEKEICKYEQKEK